MDKNYETDRKWADSFLPQIITAIRNVAGLIIEVSESSLEEDCEEATDYVFRVETGKIACRLRRPDCQFRDLTIRAWRSNGLRTELEKLREGGGAKWYFYAWTNFDGKVDRWIMVDIQKMRELGFFDVDKKEWIINRDGQTKFAIISLAKLILNDCVVADSNHPTWKQNKFSFEKVPLATPHFKAIERGERFDGQNTL